VVVGTTLLVRELIGLADDWKVHQTPVWKDQANFIMQDYARAVALYESIRGGLSPSESRKLQYAKKHTRNADFREGVQPSQE
jgi:hypothetical protein